VGAEVVAATGGRKSNRGRGEAVVAEGSGRGSITGDRREDEVER
jgi:hypothetical protein